MYSHAILHRELLFNKNKITNRFINYLELLCERRCILNELF
jgi:hypothetical protein